MTKFSSDFFKNNRQNLAKKLDGGLVVLSAYKPMQQIADMEAPFIQESNFWYLSGVDLPAWYLVYDGGRDKTWLVYPELSEVEQIFNGQPDYQAIMKSAGADNLLREADFDSLLRDLARSHSAVYSLDSEKSDNQTVINPAQKQLNTRLKRIFSGVLDCRRQLADLRAIKQPVEINAMKKAIDITRQAFELVASKTDYKFEYEIEADFWQVFRRNNAIHAYSPIVANYKNATTLHYIDNDSRLKKRSLTLMDCGANFNHYNADITRMFSFEAPTQRQIQLYGKLLEVQQAIIKLIAPGVSFADYQTQSDELMKTALTELGLDEDFRLYFPHAVSHGIGLDVHERLGSGGEFKEGMILTVEPGIYIKDEAIGLRIEDNILVTKTGSINLSKRINNRLELNWSK